MRFASRVTGFSAALVIVTSVTALAADPVVKAPASFASPSGPQTLTGDWFGYGPVLREAGFDFRLEWSQFYHGMTRGDGDKTWRYGSHVDALARFDVSKYWFWDGLSLTAQGQVNPGHNINGFGGTLLPVNTALKFPGIEGADRSNLMALFLTQRFGDRVSLSLGKINALEFARAAPLQGGGGVDTFWGNVSAPISGLTPATFHSAQLGISTKAINYSLMVYDPQDATNRPCFPISSKTASPSTAALLSRPPSQV